MKKLQRAFSFLVLTILILIQAACSKATANPGQNDESQGLSPTQGIIRTDYQNALPLPTQLALGIFKLEEANSPLSKDQAAALLPLWQAYRNLTESDTSAAEEINGLIDQIQVTLSANQLKSIAAMQLTGQDLGQFAQQQQLSLGGSQGFNMSPEQQATRQASRSNNQSSGGEPRFEGGGGGFGPGGGGFGSPPGLEQTPGALQTAIARRGGTNGSGRVSPVLVEALITYLKTKAQ